MTGDIPIGSRVIRWKGDGTRFIWDWSVGEWVEYDSDPAFLRELFANIYVDEAVPLRKEDIELGLKLAESRGYLIRIDDDG